MSKKGPQHKGKAGAKPSASTVPETSSLDALLTSLFEQSEARLVKADQRSKKDVVNKVVSGLVPIARSIVADPRSEGLQKHAVKAVLAVNSNCALGSALSKKVVSIFFTVLVDELHSNWKEYGFKESEVNPDYVRIACFLHPKQSSRALLLTLSCITLFTIACDR